MTQGIKKLSEPKILIWIGVGYSLIITTLFLLPAKEVPEVRVPFVDKIVHLVIFSVLTFIWLWFCESKKLLKYIARVVLLIFVYGIIIETLQELFFETRTADVWDVLANTIGILMGLVVFT
nr:VanZ family protein [Bacteroidota bacterium]